MSKWPIFQPLRAVKEKRARTVGFSPKNVVARFRSYCKYGCMRAPRTELRALRSSDKVVECL